MRKITRFDIYWGLYGSGIKKISLIALYLGAFALANLLVKYMGAKGLWISSFALVPFDFVCRALFNEKWKGIKLMTILMVLTILSGAITIAINYDAMNIALASVCGFAVGQVSASLFYQLYLHKSYLFKVNLSDLVAICTDSLLFQWIAFHSFDSTIMIGQIVIKFIGGLFWYWILFNRFKVQDKL